MCTILTDAFPSESPNHNLITLALTICLMQTVDDTDGKTAPIDQAFWQEQARQMASLGLRTLAICKCSWPVRSAVWTCVCCAVRGSDAECAGTRKAAAMRRWTLTPS
eukprot:2440219-Rhodomonas_salina.3